MRRSLCYGFIVLFLLAGCGQHARRMPGMPSSRNSLPADTGSLQGVVYFDRVRGLPAVARTLMPGLLPLKGATVAVYGQPVCAAVTDQQGAFTLVHIPCGVQTFTISYPDYAPSRVNYDILPGRNLADPAAPTKVTRKKWTMLIYMLSLIHI